MQRSTCDSARLSYLRDDREALVLAAHARHVAVEEHEREVLWLLLAELGEPPQGRAHIVERIGTRHVADLAAADLTEAFLGEREEDFVLRREVAVDGGRTVSDLGGDISDGNLRVAVGDEELEGGIEDGAPRALAGLLLALFSTHFPCYLRELNSV